MKKIIAVALAAVSFAACNNNGADNAAADTTSMTSTANTTSMASTTDTASTTSTTATTTTSAYTAVDGDVSYRDKKVRIMKNGKWVDADNDVTLDNGLVVYRSGRVKKLVKK
ncbi:MAG: hypothetical protein WKG06_15765 [Segetibacter sp.]